MIVRQTEIIQLWKDINPLKVQDSKPQSSVNTAFKSTTILLSRKEQYLNFQNTWTIDGRTESKEKNGIDMCKPVDENVDSKHVEVHHRIFEL